MGNSSQRRAQPMVWPRSQQLGRVLSQNPRSDGEAQVPASLRDLQPLQPPPVCQAGQSNPVCRFLFWLLAFADRSERRHDGRAADSTRRQTYVLSSNNCATNLTVFLGALLIRAPQARLCWPASRTIP